MDIVNINYEQGRINVKGKGLVLEGRITETYRGERLEEFTFTEKLVNILITQYKEENDRLKNRIKKLEAEKFINQIESSVDKDKKIERLEEKVLLMYDENKELRERCHRFDDDGVTLAMNLELANNKIRDLQKELEEYKFVKTKWKKATNVIREKVEEVENVRKAMQQKTKGYQEMENCLMKYSEKLHDTKVRLYKANERISLLESSGLTSIDDNIKESVYNKFQKEEKDKEFYKLCFENSVKKYQDLKVKYEKVDYSYNRCREENELLERDLRFLTNSNKMNVESLNILNDKIQELSKIAGKTYIWR